MPGSCLIPCISHLRGSDKLRPEDVMAVNISNNLQQSPTISNIVYDVYVHHLDICIFIVPQACLGRGWALSGSAGLPSHLVQNWPLSWPKTGDTCCVPSDPTATWLCHFWASKHFCRLPPLQPWLIMNDCCVLCVSQQRSFLWWVRSYNIVGCKVNDPRFPRKQVWLLINPFNAARLWDPICFYFARSTEQRHQFLRLWYQAGRMTMKVL